MPKDRIREDQLDLAVLDGRAISVGGRAHDIGHDHSVAPAHDLAASPTENRTTVAQTPVPPIATTRRLRCLTVELE